MNDLLCVPGRNCFVLYILMYIYKIMWVLDVGTMIVTRDLLSKRTSVKG